jgi:hypothetical protein
MLVVSRASLCAFRGAVDGISVPALDGGTKFVDCANRLTGVPKAGAIMSLNRFVAGVAMTCTLDPRDGRGCGFRGSARRQLYWYSSGQYSVA